MAFPRRGKLEYYKLRDKTGQDWGPEKLLNITVHSTSDSYFVYSDGEVIKKLLEYIGLNGDTYASLVSRVEARVLSDTSFKVDLNFTSIYGSFSFTVSEIGTATLPYIEDYLKAGKGGKDADQEVFDVAQATTENNYTVNLGTANLTNGETINKGNLLVSEDFYYYDYTTNYINAYNNSITEEDEKLFDWGYAKLSDSKYHKFKANDVEGENLVLDTAYPSSGSDYPVLTDYSMKTRYLKAATMFKPENADTFTFKTNLGEGNPDLYLSYYTDIAKDIGKKEFSSLDQTSYVPYGIGIGEIHRDDAKKVTGFSLTYLVKNNNNLYTSTKAYSNIGTTSSKTMTDFIAKNK